MGFGSFIKLLFSGWVVFAIIVLPVRLMVMGAFYVAAQPYFLAMFRTREEWYRFKHEIREEIADTKKLFNWQVNCFKSGSHENLPKFDDDAYYDGKLCSEK